MANLRKRQTGAPVPEQEKSSKDYEKLLKERGKQELTSSSKFWTRLVWGWILIFAFLAILAAGHVYCCLATMLVQVLVFRELVDVRYQAEEARKVPLFRTVQWLWFSVAMFFAYGETLTDLMTTSPISSIRLFSRYHSWIAFGMYSTLFGCTVGSFRKGSYRYQMGQLTWTLLSVALVVLQTKQIVSNIYSGLFWLLLPASLVICNDTLAYFAGRAFGRKFVDRPLLKLSPNKTWEGLIGGGIATLVFAFFWPIPLTMFDQLICPTTELTLIPSALHCTPHAVFQWTSYELPSFLHALGVTSVNLLPVQIHSVLLALYASIFGPFGGFFASAIKRAYNRKDFASIIPGHGGLMDRVDCQFLMSLCTYVHLQTFIFTEAQVDRIVNMISKLSPEDYASLMQKIGLELNSTQ